MKLQKVAGVVFFMLLWIAPCFAHHMAVVVNKANEVDEISSPKLGKIFKRELHEWPDGKSIVIVLEKGSPGQMATIERLTHQLPSELRAFLASQRDAIRVVDSEEAVLEVVKSNAGAIGMVDVRAVNDQVKVVKIDNKLPLEAGYLPH